MTYRNRCSLLIIAVSIAGFGGCKSDEKDEAFQDPFFPVQGSVPASQTMMERQAALGAAQDAMLHDIHFAGAELNSLGRSKLDAMVAGSPAGTPLKVYLNLPADGAASAERRTSVDTALRAAGLEGGAYAVSFGVNQSAMQSSAAGVSALDLKRQTTGDASASGESTNLPVKKE